MTVHDRTGAGAGSAEWQTPYDLFVRLNLRFQFDYDAFASHANALCRTYSTIEGTFSAVYANGLLSDGLLSLPSIWHQPEQIDSLDGLRQDWSGRRVFMNPPYSAGLIGRCVAAAARWRNEARVIVAVLPDSRDTRWWDEHVRPYADDYSLGRVRFIHGPENCGGTNPAKVQQCAEKHVPGEPGASPPGSTVAVVWRPDWLRR